MRYFFVMLLALSGCAAITTDQLRQDPTGKIAFQIDKNYSQVHRALVDRTRNCITAFPVASDIYSDTKTARISVRIDATTEGARVIWLIEINEIEPNKTAVQVFYLHRAWAGMASLVEDWAHERSYKCTTVPPAELA